jgi:hypothetical protein
MMAIEVLRRVLMSLTVREATALRRVAYDFRPRPTDADLARGVAPDQRGAFWGIPAVGARPPADDDGTALPEQLAPASGEIVVFLDNVDPATPERLEVVLRHELAHALGYSEEEIVSMGLTL